MKLFGVPHQIRNCQAFPMSSGCDFLMGIQMTLAMKCFGLTATVQSGADVECFASSEDFSQGLLLPGLVGVYTWMALSYSFPVEWYFIIICLYL